jgi:hypothetical protein
MPDDSVDSTVPADFRKIMDSIEDVTRSASIYQQSSSDFVKLGPLTPELERKLVDLKGMLDAYGRKNAR